MASLQSETTTVALVVHPPIALSTSVVSVPNSVYVPISGAVSRSITAVARTYGGPPDRATNGVVYLYRMRSDGVWNIVGARPVSLSDGASQYVVVLAYWFSSSDLYRVNWKTELVVPDGDRRSRRPPPRTSARTAAGIGGAGSRSACGRRSTCWSSTRSVDASARRQMARSSTRSPTRPTRGPNTEPEEVNIPDPLDGDYRVILTATGTGDYHLELIGIGDDEGEVVLEEIFGTVTEGDELTYEVAARRAGGAGGERRRLSTGEDVAAHDRRARRARQRHRRGRRPAHCGARHRPGPRP